MEGISGPFVGSEAVRAGLVRKHELRSSKYRAIFPGVYLHRQDQLSVITFAQRVEAAWLWSKREGVVAGLTAARLYGAKWLGDELPIELVSPNARPPRGIETCAMSLGECEIVRLGALTVTSLARTAFDLARRRPFSTAVARLDALAGAAPLSRIDVEEIASRHPGLRGMRQVDRVLEQHDAGSQSPKETWLRLLVVGAGFPRPRTQIPVRCGERTYYLDMGWEDLKVAIEYDGDQHRTDRRQFARDIVRLEDLQRRGWIVVRVAANTSPQEVLERLGKAWEASSLR